jgi:hypothetical protein
MLKRFLHPFGLGLLLTVSVLGGLASPALADCLSPGQARAAAQQGQIVPMSSLIGGIRTAAGGEILPPPQLCESGGRYIYIINVLKPNGQVGKVTVDATNGQILGR